MKKKMLTTVLIGICIALFFVGMFLPQLSDFKIFSLIIGLIILLSFRFARIKIESKKLHLMWALACTDIVLFSGFLKGFFVFSFIAVAIIYIYAPLIGRALGLNGVEGVWDWEEIMTDEGEIFGEERYFECNSYYSLPILLIFAAYTIFIVITS